MSLRPEATTVESELTAASALACLKTDDKQEQESKAITTTSGSNNRADDKAGEADEFDIPQKYTKSGRKRAVPFTIKLMKALSDKKNAHIVTWLPSGKSFSILKPKLFVAQTLPEYFKTAKYSSFTRKLHRWGFMRHYRGEEAGAFYHRDFQRGNLDLVEEMTCYKSEPPKSAATIVSVAEKLGNPVAVVAMPFDAPMPMGALKPVHVAKPIATRPSEFNVCPRVNSTTVAVAAMAPLTPMIAPMRISAAAFAAHSALSPMPMAPQLTTSTAATAAALNTDRLNAAIEQEVNRRIKERINAIALSRQAFAISALRQQQLMTPIAHSYSQIAAALMLKKHAGSITATSPPGPTAPAPTPAGAPPTNIQGARTA